MPVRTDNSKVDISKVDMSLQLMAHSKAKSGQVIKTVQQVDRGQHAYMSSHMTNVPMWIQRNAHGHDNRIYDLT